MTFSDKTILKNLYTRQQATKALKKHLIDAGTHKRIVDQHPVDLYTPNLFVKIGLGVLTFFICLCSLGLFALILNVGSLFGTLLVVAGASCYMMLEFMTGSKKHYNSGVDNVLMLTTVLFITSGLMFDYRGGFSEILLSSICFIIFLWLTIRFADSLAAIIACIAFLSFVFYTYINFGVFSIKSFPFLLIILSATLYYFSHKYSNNNKQFIYARVWEAISVVALLSFYFWGNYYIIKTLTVEVTRTSLPLSFSWFFWGWTMGIPVLYVVKGIRDKNVILIRAGLLLVAVAILTFRYYYSIISAEAAMVIAGLVLLITAYFLMRYLTTPRFGFAFDDNSDEENDTKNLEGFVIGQTLSGKDAPEQGTKYGGGNFGGAGAGGNY